MISVKISWIESTDNEIVLKARDPQKPFSIGIDTIDTLPIYTVQSRLNQHLRARYVPASLSSTPFDPCSESNSRMKFETQKLLNQKSANAKPA